jgi:hypothetical protein
MFSIRFAIAVLASLQFVGAAAAGIPLPQMPHLPEIRTPEIKIPPIETPNKILGVEIVGLTQPGRV